MHVRPDPVSTADTGHANLGVVPTADWADHAAGLLSDRLAAKPDLVVCLPTGSTPVPLYARLSELDPAVGSATVVLLDEYLGLPAGHPARCDSMLGGALVDRLSRPPRFVTFAVDSADPEAACRRYDADIAVLGGLDLVVLGLGANGHVGMNEPGSLPDSPTRVVELAASTREAAAGYGADPVPTHGVTLGMAGILAAREIWLLATGIGKAAILRETLDGPVTGDVPATFLRGHPGLRVIVDEAATAELG